MGRWRHSLVAAIWWSEASRSDRSLRHTAKHWATDGDCGGSRLNTMSFGLGGKHSFGLISMSLAFAVLLVSVLNRDLFVHEVLAVHVCDGVVGRFEVGEGYEAIAL